MLVTLYYNKIEYFYKFLPILLIPLLFNGFLYLIHETSITAMNYAAAHMTCKTESDRLILELAPESPNIPKALSLEIMQSSLTWLVNQYNIHSTIVGFCDKIKKAKEFYGPWILLYTSSLYLISWIYILFIQC